MLMLPKLTDLTAIEANQGNLEDDLADLPSARQIV